MLRAVAFYMAFVLTAGPGLCCCTAASLAVRSVPTLAAGPGDRPAPPARGCCCPERCGPTAGSEQTDAGVGDQRSGHKSGKHRCPCQEKTKVQATAGDSPATSWAVQEATRLLALAVELVAALPSACSDHPAPDTGGDPSPPGYRLVARQLLDFHHLLRC